MFSFQLFIQRSTSFNLLHFDPEIEKIFQRLKTIRRNKLKATAANENNQQRAIRDYVQLVANNNYSSIAQQIISANNFELKVGLISIVWWNQFGLSSLEDPNVHLPTFLEICHSIEEEWCY